MPNVITVGGGKNFDKPMNHDKPLYPEGVGVLHTLVFQKDYRIPNAAERKPEVFLIQPTTDMNGDPSTTNRFRFQCDDPQYPELKDKLAFLYAQGWWSRDLRNKNVKLWAAFTGQVAVEASQVDFTPYVGKQVKLVFKHVAKPGNEKYAHGVLEKIVDIQSPVEFGVGDAPVAVATGLPAGWQEHVDPGSGNSYFVSPEGQTQWERPSIPSVPVVPAPPVPTQSWPTS